MLDPRLNNEGDVECNFNDLLAMVHLIYNYSDTSIAALWLKTFAEHSSQMEHNMGTTWISDKHPSPLRHLTR